VVVGERVEAMARAPFGTIKVLVACFPQQGTSKSRRESRVWACGEDPPWTSMGLGRWHARWEMQMPGEDTHGVPM